MNLDNLKIFLVGGAVRDELLGVPCTERDWVVIGSSESEMLSLGFRKVGKDFPVFIHKGTGEEYALARTERKTAKGYYGFQCDFSPSITLEDDLMRRDLTINAIAKDLNGKIIDPFGGQKDLQNKVLRHVSSAFVEDPIRVLRVARFAAKLANFGFKVAPETIKLMRTIVENEELDYLTPERVWKEIEKSLITNAPQKFFLVLRECDALVKIFPELDRLWGVPQNPKWHPEIDTGIHVMLALQQAVKLSQDPKIRFAVLCHDLGKGLTKPDILPSHHGHEQQGVELINNWCAKYKVPNNYKNLAVRVAAWHLHSHTALQLTPKKILKLFVALDAFRQPNNLQDFLLACTADNLGRKDQDNNKYLQAEFLNNIFIEIKKITAKQFVEQGITGKKLGDAIHSAQVKLIAKLKKDYV
jgi:tRNA nucleotidyltransferase (CCA-adding enzyme)